jgi:hypothetical protein
MQTFISRFPFRRRWSVLVALAGLTLVCTSRLKQSSDAATDVENAAADLSRPLDGRDCETDVIVHDCESVEEFESKLTTFKVTDAGVRYVSYGYIGRDANFHYIVSRLWTTEIYRLKIETIPPPTTDRVLREHVSALAGEGGGPWPQTTRYPKYDDWRYAAGLMNDRLDAVVGQKPPLIGVNSGSRQSKETVLSR